MGAFYGGSDLFEGINERRDRGVIDDVAIGGEILARRIRAILFMALGRDGLGSTTFALTRPAIVIRSRFVRHRSGSVCHTCDLPNGYSAASRSNLFL